MFGNTASNFDFMYEVKLHTIVKNEIDQVLLIQAKR